MIGRKNSNFTYHIHPSIKSQQRTQLLGRLFSTLQGLRRDPTSHEGWQSNPFATFLINRIVARHIIGNGGRL